MIQELKDAYGHIFEDALLNEIIQVATYKKIPEGFKLMEIGEYIKAIPLLLSGVIKVLREDRNGDELVLYFLENGDTCATTISCCVGHKKSQIRALAETEAIVIMIPVGKMEEWMANYPTWRNFILESYHNRLNEMMETVDSIAFLNMDERLLKYLRDKARVTGSSTINNTHQEIAYALHTSRVVVSRLLKKLENMGKLELHRYHLKIIDL